MITKYRVVLETECKECMEFLDKHYGENPSQSISPLIDSPHYGQHVKGVEVRKRTKLWVWEDEKGPTIDEQRLIAYSLSQKSEKEATS